MVIAVDEIVALIAVSAIVAPIAVDEIVAVIAVDEIDALIAVAAIVFDVTVVGMVIAVVMVVDDDIVDFVGYLKHRSFPPNLAWKLQSLGNGEIREKTWSLLGEARRHYRI